MLVFQTWLGAGIKGGSTLGAIELGGALELALGGSVGGVVIGLDDIVEKLRRAGLQSV